MYRPLTVSILLFIFISIGLYHIFVRSRTTELYHNLDLNHKWIGIIDMDYDHGINVSDILRGDDAILILDNRNALVRQLQAKQPETQQFTPESLLDLSLFDDNNDGLITSEDLIFNHLYLLVIHESGQFYQILPLAKSGIHAIKVSHVSPYGNYTIIMGDGSERTLYELQERKRLKPAL